MRALGRKIDIGFDHTGHGAQGLLSPPDTRRATQTFYIEIDALLAHIKASGTDRCDDGRDIRWPGKAHIGPLRREIDDNTLNARHRADGLFDLGHARGAMQTFDRQMQASSDLLRRGQSIQSQKIISQDIILRRMPVRQPPIYMGLGTYNQNR